MHNWRRCCDIRLSLSSRTEKLKNKRDTADHQHVPPGLNRALQVRTADRLRDALMRDAQSDLPRISALSADDQRELCEVGGGRLAAVAIQVEWLAEAEAPAELEGLCIREVGRLMSEHVRRTDLVGSLRHDTLIVLAPGMDPAGGASLCERLRRLLVDRRLEIDGVAVSLRVRVGAAYRSPASPGGWTTHGLAAEAQLHATNKPLAA
jgi:hypothetical protein